MRSLIRIVIVLLLVMGISIGGAEQKGSARATLVVVGSSAAGTAAIKHLCQDNTIEIIWVSDQTESPYNTVKIGSIVKGSKTERDIGLLKRHALANEPILKFGRKVIAIEPEHKVLVLDTGEKIIYEKLFWGTGTRAGIPTTCQQAGLEGVFCFGKLADAFAIKNYLETHKVKQAVVVGFGLNGAELCDILRKRGITVHVIDRNDRLLHNHTNEEGAQFLQDKIAQEGVTFHLNNSVKEMLHENKQVKEMVLLNGEKIYCQLVAFTGINKVNSEIAENAGIEVKQGSIVVDKHLQTSVPTIFAGGDNILITDLASGIVRRSCKWSDAEHQGAIAAANMLGKNKVYKGSVIMQHSRFFGYSFVSCGSVANPPPEYEQFVYRDADDYLLFLKLNGVLKGLLLITRQKLKSLKVLKWLIEVGIPVENDQLIAMIDKQVKKEN